jgi:integrase
MTYLLRLATWAGNKGPWELTTDDLAAFLAAGDWKPETRKSARSTLRAFYAWAETTGRVERNPAQSLKPIRVPSGAPKPAPVNRLIDAYQTADHRTRLMLALAAQAGLRRNEIATLHTDHIADGFLRITGKGSKVRRVPIHAELIEALEAVPPGWVFPGRVDGHISANRVGEILSAAMGGHSAHTLRHRFATDAYFDTRDIAVVQRLLGHSKPETTIRYTEVPDELLVNAVRGIRSLSSDTEAS